jgi:hypothetical protein
MGPAVVLLSASLRRTLVRSVLYSAFAKQCILRKDFEPARYLKLKTN